MESKKTYRIEKAGCEKELYTIRKASYDKTVTETGRWDHAGAEYGINVSSILTRLIQEAGRFCLHYASDLFYDWKAVEKSLKMWKEQDEVIYVFGFRDSGVDTAEVIARNLETMPGYYYRSIWALVMTKNGNDIDLTFNRIDSIKKEKKKRSAVTGSVRSVIRS